MHKQHRYRQGFTLIELSIVLVIIGLIIGGVLVGQDLIKAAATRRRLPRLRNIIRRSTRSKPNTMAIPGDYLHRSANFGFSREWTGACQERTVTVY